MPASLTLNDLVACKPIVTHLVQLIMWQSWFLQLFFLLLLMLRLFVLFLRAGAAVLDGAEIPAAALDVLQLSAAGFAVLDRTELLGAALDALHLVAVGAALLDASRLLQDGIRIWAKSLPASS